MCVLIHACECRCTHANVHVSKSRTTSAIGPHLPPCMRQCLSCHLQLHYSHKASPSEKFQGSSFFHFTHLCRNSVITKNFLLTIFFFSCGFLGLELMFSCFCPLNHPPSSAIVILPLNFCHFIQVLNFCILVKFNSHFFLNLNLFFKVF